MNSLPYDARDVGNGRIKKLYSGVRAESYSMLQVFVKHEMQVNIRLKCRSYLIGKLPSADIFRLLGLRIRPSVALRGIAYG